MSQRSKIGTAYLSADIQLSAEGKAPSEIRLLRYGPNESDYGSFVFDEIAAASVMSWFGTKDIPRLYSDWNHEMIPKYPGERITREMGKSSCSFVPEIRNGELWASSIEWSESGRADVEDHSYNLFSPAFEYQYGDDDLCRPKKLINFALVNMAGLNGIAPLIAAMAKTQETEMEFERLYNEIKPQLEAANARIKVLESATGEVVALSAAVGLRGDASSTERQSTVHGLVTLRQSVLKLAGQETPEGALTALQGLVTLRGSVFKLTGQETPEGAVAALHGMKVNADKVVALEAKIESDKTAALTAELDGVWQDAMKTGKLTPGNKPGIEASLLELAGGKVTPSVVSAAKTFVATLTASVKTEATREPPGKITLSPERIEIARQMGRNIKDVEAFELSRQGQ